MSNYYASARSNYFRVDSIEKLKDSMHPEIDVWIKSKDEKLVCLLCNSETGWPTTVYDEIVNEYIDWDVEIAVIPHLQDGEWCVIQEIGNENLKFLVGYSSAFNNKGDSIQVNLNDVYKELPDGVSMCEY